MNKRNDGFLQVIERLRSLDEPVSEWEPSKFVGGVFKRRSRRRRCRFAVGAVSLLAVILLLWPREPPASPQETNTLSAGPPGSTESAVEGSSSSDSDNLEHVKALLHEVDNALGAGVAARKALERHLFTLHRARLSATLSLPDRLE